MAEGAKQLTRIRNASSEPPVGVLTDAERALLLGGQPSAEPPWFVRLVRGVQQGITSGLSQVGSSVSVKNAVLSKGLKWKQAAPGGQSPHFAHVENVHPSTVEPTASKEKKDLGHWFRVVIEPDASAPVQNTPSPLFHEYVNQYGKKGQMPVVGLTARQVQVLGNGRSIVLGQMYENEADANYVDPQTQKRGRNPKYYRALIGRIDPTKHTVTTRLLAEVPMHSVTLTPIEQTVRGKKQVDNWMTFPASGKVSSIMVHPRNVVYVDEKFADSKDVDLVIETWEKKLRETANEVIV